MASSPRSEPERREWDCREDYPEYWRRIEKAYWPLLSWEDVKAADLLASETISSWPKRVVLTADQIFLNSFFSNDSRLSIVVLKEFPVAKRLCNPICPTSGSHPIQQEITSGVYIRRNSTLRPYFPLTKPQVPQSDAQPLKPLHTGLLRTQLNVFRAEGLRLRRRYFSSPLPGAVRSTGQLSPLLEMPGRTLPTSSEHWKPSHWEVGMEQVSGLFKIVFGALVSCVLALAAERLYKETQPALSCLAVTVSE